MLHTIIYDNRVEGGYTFYERTPGFPEEYLKDIASVCNTIGEPASESTSIRYQPLPGNMYLLSVVQRVLSAEHQSRRHFRSVNFLMDGAGAMEFFSVPFCSEILYAYASQCYQDRLVSYGRGWYYYRSKAAQEPQTSPLLSPDPLYTCYLQPRLQAFIGSPYSPDAEINFLLHTLPHALRPQLSFTIGMESSPECGSCVFNFSSAENIRNMRANGYDGCPGTTKYEVLIQDDQVSTYGNLEPTAQAQADKFRKLLTAKAYPALRYLIKTRRDLINACSAENLEEILAEYDDIEISAAIGRAKRDNELTDDGERMLEDSRPRKNKHKNKHKNKPKNKPGFMDRLAPSKPVSNSGHKPNAAIEKPVSNCSQEYSTHGEDSMELGGGVTEFDAALEDTINVHDPVPTPPQIQGAYSGGGQRHSSLPSQAQTSGSPADRNRMYRLVWLIITILSLAIFVFIQFVVITLSAHSNATLGIVFITLDGVLSLLSTLGSFICGGITVYGLLQFFRRRKK